MNGLSFLYIGTIIIVAAGGYFIGSRFGEVPAVVGALVFGFLAYAMLLVLARLNHRDSLALFIQCDKCNNIQGSFSQDADQLL